VTAPQSLFGISGLTVGGVGIWGLLLLSVGSNVRSWIVGAADRKRAETEGESAGDRATEEARAHLFTQMQQRMSDMEAHIRRLEARVDELEEERRTHLTELIELRGARQVETRVRQRTQEIVSAERVNGGQA